MASRYPAVDSKRCDALARWRNNDPVPLAKQTRCKRHARHFRDGRCVCAAHRDARKVTFVCGNRFEALPGTIQED